MPKSFINTVRNYRGSDRDGAGAITQFNCMVTRSGRSFNTLPQTSRSFSGSGLVSRSSSRHRRSNEYQPKLHTSSVPPSWGYLPIMTRYGLILRETQIDFFADPLLIKALPEGDCDNARDLILGKERPAQQFSLICSVYLQGDFGCPTTYQKFKITVPKTPLVKQILKPHTNLDNPKKEIRLQLKLISSEPTTRKVMSIVRSPTVKRTALEMGETSSPAKKMKVLNEEHTIMHTSPAKQVLILQAKSQIPQNCGKKIVIPFYRPDHTIQPINPILGSDTKTGAYTCVQCDRVFVNYAAARSHALAHTLSQNRCQLCGKVFSRNWLLQGHMRTHSGEKPYQCQECDKSFADRSNLRSHILTHTTKSREFVCEICHRAFAQKRYLNKHQQEVCIKPALVTE